MQLQAILPLESMAAPAVVLSAALFIFSGVFFIYLFFDIQAIFVTISVRFAGFVVRCAEIPFASPKDGDRKSRSSTLAEPG